MTRCECACASGSVALYAGLYAVEAGRAQHVLVIGVEKMNLLPTPQMTHVLACSSHWPSEGSKGMSFPMLFAEYAKGYQAHYEISDRRPREDAVDRRAPCATRTAPRTRSPTSRTARPRSKRS